MLSLTPSIHLAPSKVKSWLVQWGDKTWVLFAQLVENAAIKCTNKVNTEAISFSETLSARECVFEQCRVVQRNSTSHDCLNSSSHTRNITKNTSRIKLHIIYSTTDSSCNACLSLVFC